MYRNFSPSRFEHVKTPKSNSRKLSQPILDTPASVVRSARKSPQKAKTDPSFINDLQFQLTHALNQQVGINHQYTRLENINKQLEHKNARLIEEMKQMREGEVQKDKELYNLQVHNNYLLTEKNELEKKAGENKNRIFKLERKLLELARMLGITSIKDISLSHFEESRRDSQKADQDWNSKSVETESLGQFHEKSEKHVKELEIKIANQSYEIQVLRAALDSRDRSEPLNELDKDSLVKEAEEIRLRFIELKKETDYLSKENQILLTDNEILREKLSEHVEIDSYRSEEKKQAEQQTLFLQNENRLWQKKVEVLEEEKGSLYGFLEELKQKLQKLEEENAQLDSSLREHTRDDQTKEAYSLLELESKESQIKLLKEQLNQEKERTKNLAQRVNEEVNSSKSLKQEGKNYAKIEYINNQLLKEIDVLKHLIEEQDKEIERCQEANEQLAREQNELHDAIQAFIYRSLSSEDSNRSSSIRSLTSSPNHSKKMDSETVIEHLHQLELGRQGLKQALNDAVNLCAAYRVKDKEKDTTLQQKDHKINTLNDAKSAIEQILGVQLIALKGKNDKLLENEQNSLEKIKSLKAENEQLRAVIKTYEKKPFELPASLSNRYHRRINS